MFDYSVIKIIEKTLNYVDPRLVNHGKRVSYLVYNALKRYGKYKDDIIGKVVLLALLHDIGAYKTEEIDKMVQFETERVWEHSVYGYLFIKNFTPLSEFAPIILFHHANCRELMHLTPDMRELAQIIYIADRIDVLYQTSDLDVKTFKEHFDIRRDTQFYSHLLDLFFYDGFKNSLNGINDDEQFNNILYYNINAKDTEAFIQMTVFSIDFKSAQTVTHTIAVACVSNYLSKFIDIDPEEKEWLYTGAMLHDLGKISTPPEILEKTERLTGVETEIMRKHVLITEEILKDEIDEVCIQLSIRHHEKLNGTGYPYGLKASNLTTAQRLIAVADIFSALYGTRTYKKSFTKKEITDILKGMAKHGYIDEYITSTVIKKLNRIINEVKKTSEPILKVYDQIQEEFTELLEKANNFKNEIGVGEIID